MHNEVNRARFPDWSGPEGQFGVWRRVGATPANTPSPAAPLPAGPRLRALQQGSSFHGKFASSPLIFFALIIKSVIVKYSTSNRKEILNIFNMKSKQSLLIHPCVL